MTRTEQTYVVMRVALGVGVLALPSTARELWRRIGAPGDVRLLGLRDLALGGAAVATRNRPRPHRWTLAVCVASDAVDAVVCASAARRTRRPLAVLAAASGVAGAATGLALLRSGGGSGLHRAAKQSVASEVVCASDAVGI
jgi:hypothetical protein